ncbi:phage GP46 family protein [Rahnella aceris]|uniref:phage GP46 family protein n=1 Tax=Rahnella sp. (strain Y9602) TaxID=2703885 RepID=UPI001C265571|nr:phage GP46 family protein [Rahnella aceris]MBU9866823.1 phage GP46 family protein [Rahnella aceris]
MILILNGQLTDPTEVLNPLPRAVIISLFSWRRANPDDDASTPMGWWGDTYPTADNDRIGSRLWLLEREKITNDTLNRADDYIKEALDWMLDDGVAAKITTEVRRSGLSEAVASVSIYQRDGNVYNLTFDEFWKELNYGR